MSNLPIISDYDGELSTSPVRTAATRQISPLQVMWRGRWIILLCSALAIGAGVGYLMVQTPIYSATSRVDIEAENMGARLGTDVGGENNHTATYLATQCEVIKSNQILATVSERSELRGMKTFEDEANPIGRLKAGVSATTTKLDDLITVSFESPYPSEAAAITNFIVESYVQYLKSQTINQAAELLKILVKEKTQRDEELADKGKEMLDFRLANPTISYTADGKTNITYVNLSRLSEALTTQHLKVLEDQAVVNNALALAKPENIDKKNAWMNMQKTSGGGSASAAAQEIRKLEMQIKSLTLTLGEASPIVVAMQQQLKDLKAELESQLLLTFEGYLGAVQQNYASDQLHEANIQDEYNKVQQQATGLNAQEAKLQAMQLDANRLQRLVDSLDGRIKDIKLVAPTGAMNITVLEAAKPNFVPVKPKWSVVLFGAVAGGLALGGGLAYLRELMDHRLRTVDDIRNTLNLPVLGAIPRMTGKETLVARGQKVHIEPMSNIAEAYRTIRTAIYFGAREEKAKTLVITSASPGDGKSTSASNLAIAMAQAGQRVLLIDADLRKPVMHKIFKLDDATGLTSVVTGKSPLSEAVKITEVPGLYVLPSGPIPRNPAEILTSAAFVKMIEKLCTKFDHIVIDSPPVAPVTDADILGGLCDATIMVVRANKSTRRVSLSAVNYLMSVGSKMLGVVANEVPGNDGNYGYHGYGYGYYSTRGVLSTKHVKAIEGNGHTTALVEASNGSRS